MKKVMKTIKKQRGLSLIEVLVTITITSIGLMGLVSLQMQAVRSTTDSGNRSQAVWVLNDILSRIRANKVSSESYTTPFNCAGGAPGNTCSAYHTGTAAGPAVIACTGPQMAAWDLFEVACGSPKNDTPGQIFFGNSIDYLPQAQLTITCNIAPCADGDPLNIVLQWRAKSDNESITGAQRTANSGTYTVQHLGFQP